MLPWRQCAWVPSPLVGSSPVDVVHGRQAVPAGIGRAGPEPPLNGYNSRRVIPQALAASWRHWRLEAGGEDPPPCRGGPARLCCRAA